MPRASSGNAPVEVADDGYRDDDRDDELDTATLLDQGEQLLAESARLLRRLDAALHSRRSAPPGGDADPDAGR